MQDLNFVVGEPPQTTVEQALDWLLTKAAIKTNGSFGACAAYTSVLRAPFSRLAYGMYGAGAATVFSEQPVQASQVERDANLAKRIAQLVHFRCRGLGPVVVGTSAHLLSISVAPSVTRGLELKSRPASTTGGRRGPGPVHGHIRIIQRGRRQGR